MTDPIVAFLNARENEREQEAREAGPYWQRKAACAADDPGVMVMDDDHSYPLVVNPAWVLADVAAKRAILAIHRPCIDSAWPQPGHCAECWDPTTEDWRPMPCPTVRALASAYRDHPDFDPSWAS